jgi:hypothetical protein
VDPKPGCAIHRDRQPEVFRVEELNNPLKAILDFDVLLVPLKSPRICVRLVHIDAHGEKQATNKNARNDDNEPKEERRTTQVGRSKRG